MVKKLIILFLLISSVGYAQAPIFKKLDTLNFVKIVDKLFIDHNIDNYSLRVFTNYKSKQFRVSNDDFKSRYVPNNRYGVGVGFASSKLLIDVAFNIKGNEDVTHRFDMQGTTIIGKKNYVNFYLQTYKGFNVKNNYGADPVFRDDIRSFTMGVNALRTLPEIEFSFSKLKAGLDHLDKKFYITGGFGAFWFYDYFSAEDDILPSSAELLFNEEAHIKRYNSTALGVLGGVLTVIKLPYDLTLSCNLMPGIGGVYKHVTLQGGTYKPKNHLLFKADYSIALGYNVERYYLSLIYGGGIYSTDLGYDNNYNFNLTKAKLAIGYKLSGRRKKQ
ncbi:DUF4421 family protein [Tamlana sp. 2_MG-2023]|uniref:DUF4421 family protein n=1 Tax=unclassified Tamlana TaxID=2614803 RepID=UPI0026E19331|nr:MULTISPECIES: DUF4421 family protein [unclassified Tamlana]MDO6759364.1 DUF4421 family protein [Tamlana sp. 2_MG-2023]MDO6790497.1 DUF4421 family protein [Tamlana sp. 1_MG-2023]